MSDTCYVIKTEEGEKRYDLGYRSLDESQVRKVVVTGSAEVAFSRQQVDVNSDLLDADQRLKAAERGGELNVLIQAKAVG